MDADKCLHLRLMRMPGPVPLYHCTACSSGFLFSSYLPIPPGHFLEVARQFAGSDKLFERVKREVDVVDAGLVLPFDEQGPAWSNPANMRDLEQEQEQRKRNGPL